MILVTPLNNRRIIFPEVWS